MAAEHVQNLGELVDLGPTEQPAERRHAFVVACRDAASLSRTHAHSAELQHRERSAVASRANCAMENGTGVRQPYCYRRYDEDRAKNQQEDGGAEDVGAPF